MRLRRLRAGAATWVSETDTYPFRLAIIAQLFARQEGKSHFGLKPGLGGMAELRALSSIISLLEGSGERADFLTALEPDIKQQETVPRDRDEDHHGPEDDKQIDHTGTSETGATA